MAYKQLTLEQAAKQINCRPKYLLEQAIQGDAPCTRQGDKLFFEQEEIVNWWSLHIINADFDHEKIRLPENSAADCPVLPSSLCSLDSIDTAIKGKSKNAILKSLTALAERTGQLYNASEFHESLRAREEQGSTALPGGVALVHPQSRDEFLFEESFICLAKAQAPVFFGEQNGLTTDLFFVIACKDDIHLQVLGTLSSIMVCTNLLNDLRRAETAAEMLTALLTAEAISPRR